jgi:hypothetical protein
MNLILSIIYPIFAVGIDYSIVINTNMNKVMKKLALLIITLVVLGSCKKTEEPAPVPEQELVPIQIATAVTRATDYAFETGDNVGLFVVNEPKNLQIRGNHVDNCRFTFDGTKWNAGEETYWLDATTKADFYCYYPYTSSVSSITAFPFQVCQDQSSESGYKASDLMWGKVQGIAPTPDPVMVTVNHSMSCLIVNLKAGTGWNEDDIKEAEVTLCGLRTSALVNLADGTVIADGGTAEMKPLPIGAGIFKALVVPQKVSDSELVRVKVGTNSYSLKTSIDLKSGRQHTCTVVINRTGEGINIGIGPWETDGIDYGGPVE